MTFVTHLPLKFNYVNFYEQAAVKIYVTRKEQKFFSRLIHCRSFARCEKSILHMILDVTIILGCIRVIATVRESNFANDRKIK